MTSKHHKHEPYRLNTFLSIHPSINPFLTQILTCNRVYLSPFHIFKHAFAYAVPIHQDPVGPGGRVGLPKSLYQGPEHAAEAFNEFLTVLLRADLGHIARVGAVYRGN